MDGSVRIGSDLRLDDDPVDGLAVSGGKARASLSVGSAGSTAAYSRPASMV